MRSISFGPTHVFGTDDNIDTQISRNSSANTSQRGLREISFIAGDDLYRENMKGIKTLAMKSICHCRFSFDPNRNYKSYCYEFCGLFNL